MVGKTTAKTVCGSIGATSADLDTVRDVVSVNYYSQGGDTEARYIITEKLWEFIMVDISQVDTL